jgi:hypothetical protein
MQSSGGRGEQAQLVQAQDYRKDGKKTYKKLQEVI